MIEEIYLLKIKKKALEDEFFINLEFEKLRKTENKKVSLLIINRFLIFFPINYSFL